MLGCNTIDAALSRRALHQFSCELHLLLTFSRFQKMLFNAFPLFTL